MGKLTTMKYTDKDIMQLFAAFSALYDKIEALESKVAQLEEKKGCKVIPMKIKEPRITQKT